MTEQESTPKATARLLPLSHWTWIDPMSSTQTTVERVARLPLATDCFPYYHWRDFRRDCLRKLDRYEKKRK